MPNSIKYNTSAETLALKKGNFWIGTNDVSKGNTPTSGYWNGITPPAGGYTIYLNKSTQGPAIFVAANDSELISITNRIAGSNYTTVGQCLSWFATQTDKIVLNRDYESIITNGLVLNLDAGFSPSYPTTGTTFYDLISEANNGVLTNGPTYNIGDGGHIIFDGTNDYVSITNFNYGRTSFSAESWIMYTANTSGYKVGAVGSWVSGGSAQNQFLLFSEGAGGIAPGWAFFAITSTTGTDFFVRDSNYMLINTWYQLCGVFDGSSLKIYLNGELKNTSNIGSTVTVYNNNRPIEIGSFNASYNTQCKVSSTRLYNRALSSSEINQNYYATLNGKMMTTNGLVLNLQAGNLRSYPGSGTVWKDVSGNSNDGTLINGPTYNSTNGGSIVFDGVNDYTQVTSPFGNIDWSSRAWSFSAWMKLSSLGDKCLVNLNSANSTDYIVTNVFYGDGSSYWYFIKNSANTQTNFKTPGGTFTTNELFYFTMTYNGNGLSNSNINFYKNGIQVATSQGGSAGLSNQTGLQIGGNYPLHGNVYNFLMYNRTLSSTEILQNYNATKGLFGL
jgi:hypothetical protein